MSASRVTLAGQEAGVEVIRSALELTDLIAVAPGRSAAVLTAISATVAVERVSARGYEGRLLFAQSSSVAAEDIAAVPKVGATSGAILNGGRVRLSRVKMGVSDGLRCSGGAQVWLEDADLDAGHQRVLGVDDCALEGRRLRLQGYLRAQSATTRVDLEDAAFVGGGELGAQIEGGAQATLRRVRVESTSQEGLRVKGPSAARAEDVEIDAVGGFGILITSDGRLDGLRVAVRGADVGLQTNRSTLRGEDFELSGCGTGLSVTEAQRELSLDRLTARGARGAGISIGGWGPSYGVAALVALDNAVGLELSPDVPRAAVEGSTRLSRNIGPLVVCSTWPCVRPGPR